MTFAAPALLLGLLLVPAGIAGYLLVQRRRSRYAIRFTNVDLLANLAPRRPAWRRHLPPLLYLGAIAALVFALARPSMVVAVPREEATIMLALDVSGSMQATDVAPTRLAAAQAAASEFIDQLPSSFRVGIVVFSTEARLLVSPTTDRARLHDALNGLRANGGTALGDALALSLESATADVAANGSGSTGSNGSTPSPAPAGSPDPAASPGVSPAPSAQPDATENGVPVIATVLLSDGANSTGRLEPLDAASEAAAAGMPVYTISLGTDAGVVQVPNRVGILQPLQVPPDSETLAAIAEITGGRAFEAPTANELSQIYENLGSRVGFVQQEQEVTQWFAAGALVLVVTGAGLAAFWFNRFP